MDGDPAEVTGVYERFMKELAAGNNRTGLSIRDEARADLVRTALDDVAPGAPEPSASPDDEPIVFPVHRMGP